MPFTCTPLTQVMSAPLAVLWTPCHCKTHAMLSVHAPHATDVRMRGAVRQHQASIFA
jgi:hypothetical protein